MAGAFVAGNILQFTGFGFFRPPVRLACHIPDTAKGQTSALSERARNYY